MKVDDRVNRLVLIIGTDVLPRRELIAALELRQSARRNFRDNYLKPATAKGLVKMQFPEVPSRPEQAYKLTAKGLELFSKLKEVAEGEDDRAEACATQYARGTRSGNAAVYPEFSDSSNGRCGSKMAT